MMMMTRIASLRRRPTAILLALILGGAGLLQLADANPAASQTVTLYARPTGSDVTDPGAEAWVSTPAIDIPLTAQQAAYPTGGSIPTVAAKALHRGGKLYIRVEWSDATKDDSTLKVENFSDAAALEFPVTASATVPSICMGEAGKGVNIWQWRADSQAGHADPVERYPNAFIEMYPSTERVFYTAREAGNPYAADEGGPVQDLVAQSFGTLAKATNQGVHGKGSYTDGKWAVVFTRELQTGDAGLTAFRPSATTDMAFAVWDGSKQERSGQKAVSAFLRLSVIEDGSGGGNGWTWLIAAGLLGGTAAFGVALAALAGRQK